MVAAHLSPLITKKSMAALKTFQWLVLENADQCIAQQLSDTLGSQQSEQPIGPPVEITRGTAFS